MLANPILVENFMCVRTDLVQEQSIGNLIWNDKESQGNLDGSVWEIKVSPFFLAVQGYEAPVSVVHGLKDDDMKAAMDFL